VSDDSTCYLDAGVEIFSLTWNKSNVRSFKYSDIHHVKFSKSNSSLTVRIFTISPFLPIFMSAFFRLL
jgi:hypothetical protein